MKIAFDGALARAMVSCAVVLGSVGLTAQTAQASGFQLKENSAAALGNAFAGAASAAEDASTVFNNPAGMTRLQGNQALVVGTFIIPTANFEGSAQTNTGAAVSGGNGRDAGVPAFVPAMYGVYSLSPDLKLGLAVTVPFGLSTKYEDNWVGRYNAIKSQLATLNVNPSLAYRVNDWLSIGGGVSAQYEDVKLTNAIRLAPFNDAIGEVRGSGWGYGFNGGVLIEPKPGTRIGVTYRSQIHARLQGEAAFILPSGLPGAVAANFRSTDISAELRTPETITVSGYHEINPQWAIMADIAWTNWSVFQDLTILRSNGSVLSTKPERWNDTFFGAVGLTYRHSDEVTLRTGFAYDQSPVENQFRTARIPDQDRYWLAFGGSYKPSPGVTLDAGFTHIFVRKASIADSFAIPLAGTATGTLTGNYNSSIDIFTVSATLKF